MPSGMQGFWTVLIFDNIQNYLLLAFDKHGAVTFQPLRNDGNIIIIQCKGISRFK